MGSVQLGIGDPFAPTQTGASDVVRVVPAGRTPPGWVAVVDGEGPGGRAVTVVHEDAADLRGAAVLDAVSNNSDRKGSHLVRDGAGVLWGVRPRADPATRSPSCAPCCGDGPASRCASRT